MKHINSLLFVYKLSKITKITKFFDHENLELYGTRFYPQNTLIMYCVCMNHANANLTKDFRVTRVRHITELKFSLVHCFLQNKRFDYFPVAFISVQKI